MSDIEPRLFDEVLTFIQALASIGPETFIAERLHLYAFQSDDWRGNWGPSLTWRLIESWTLE